MSKSKAKPPVGNTGVLIPTNPCFTYALDWLRYSVDADVPHNEVLPAIEPFVWYGETIPPFPNYTHARKLNIGRVDWHETDKRQKQLVTLTGADLRAVERDGWHIPDVLSYALQLPGFKATRIDFAADVFNHEAKARMVYLWHRRGRCKTRAKAATFLRTDEKTGMTGETTYIGSRESDKFLRVYNKALEQGVKGDWTRIELEVKGAYARVAANAMQRHGLIEGGKAMIRQYIQTGIEWFDKAVAPGTDDVYLDVVAHAPTDTEKWVINVALPAVVEAIKSDVPGVRAAVAEALRGVYKQRGLKGGLREERVRELRALDEWMSG